MCFPSMPASGSESRFELRSGTGSSGPSLQCSCCTRQQGPLLNASTVHSPRPPMGAMTSMGSIAMIPVSKSPWRGRFDLVVGRGWTAFPESGPVAMSASADDGWSMRSSGDRGGGGRLVASVSFAGMDRSSSPGHRALIRFCTVGHWAHRPSGSSRRPSRSTPTGGSGPPRPADGVGATVVRRTAR